MSSELQQLYQQIILDHAKYRHGAAAEPLGSLAEAAGTGLRLGESHQVNPTCGDEVTVRVGIRARGADPAHPGTPADGIELFAWRGDGCSISMASASVLNDTVTGLGTDEAGALVDTFRELLRSRGTIEPDEDALGDAAAFAGVSRYPARVKCAMLPWVAFEAALLAARTAP